MGSTKERRIPYWRILAVIIVGAMLLSPKLDWGNFGQIHISATPVSGTNTPNTQVSLVPVPDQVMAGGVEVESTEVPIVTETLPIAIVNMIRFIQHRNYKIYPRMAEEIALAADKASKEFKVPGTILLAIMDIESDYRYDAISKAKAIGLMQIHVATWLDKKNKSNLIDAGIADTKKALFDPETNIRAGAYILQLYMLEGMKKRVSNPVQYAATRYFGGPKNSYYFKLIAALGEFQIFNYTHIMVEAQASKKGASNGEG